MLEVDEEIKRTYSVISLRSVSSISMLSTRACFAENCRKEFHTEGISGNWPVLAASTRALRRVAKPKVRYYYPGQNVTVPAPLRG